MSSSQSDLPITPYDRGTSSGHSGSETSEERSLERDASGKTALTQKRMLHLVDGQGRIGLTVAEARRLVPDEHHGSISGALSNLHQKGLIVRLKERRDRCQVYVLPEFAFTRETVPHGRNKQPGLSDDEKEWVESCKRRVLLTNSDPISVSRGAMNRLIAMIERLS
jgi:hypothetical protein